MIIHIINWFTPQEKTPKCCTALLGVQQSIHYKNNKEVSPDALFVFINGDYYIKAKNGVDERWVIGLFCTYCFVPFNVSKFDGRPFKLTLRYWAYFPDIIDCPNEENQEMFVY